MNYYYREAPNNNFPFLWGGPNPIVAPFIAAHSGLIRVQDVPTMRNMLGSFLSGNFPRLASFTDEQPSHSQWFDGSYLLDFGRER